MLMYMSIKNKPFRDNIQRVADIDILYGRKEVFIHGKEAD